MMVAKGSHLNFPFIGLHLSSVWITHWVHEIYEKLQ